MRLKLVATAVVTVVSALCSAENVAELCSLTNDWGRGSILDFRRKVYETVPAAAGNDSAEAIREWYRELTLYPDLLAETGTTYWMDAKVSAMAFCVRMKLVDTSTNCWFAAAELWNRYRGIIQEAESNACLNVDLAAVIRTNPGRVNQILDENRSRKIRVWNLKCVEPPLARIVTNEFPKSILPLLPETERAAMMSNVLMRAGF